MAFFYKEKLHLQIIENIFFVDPEEVPSHLQMEILDLQASPVYTKKAICKIFTSVCANTSSKIYFLWQNKCSAYLALTYVSKRSRE